MTATDETSDSERGGGRATPHGVFNKYITTTMELIENHWKPMKIN